MERRGTVRERLDRAMKFRYNMRRLDHREHMIEEPLPIVNQRQITMEASILASVITGEEEKEKEGRL